MVILEGIYLLLKKYTRFFVRIMQIFVKEKISLEYMSPALFDSFIDGLEDDVNVSVLSMMPYYGNALLVREKKSSINVAGLLSAYNDVWKSVEQIRFKDVAKEVSPVQLNIVESKEDVLNISEFKVEIECREEKVFIALPYAHMAPFKKKLLKRPEF